jgi:hypothetical protein
MTVVVGGDFYFAIGQDVVFLDISQTLVAVPLEELSEMVEVVRHEGV